MAGISLSSFAKRLSFRPHKGFVHRLLGIYMSEVLINLAFIRQLAKLVLPIKPPNTFSLHFTFAQAYSRFSIFSLPLSARLLDDKKCELKKKWWLRNKALCIPCWQARKKRKRKQKKWKKGFMVPAKSKSVVFAMKNISSNGDLHSARMLFRCAYRHWTEKRCRSPKGPEKESIRSPFGCFLANVEKIVLESERSLNLQWSIKLKSF